MCLLGKLINCCTISPSGLLLERNDLNVSNLWLVEDRDQAMWMRAHPPDSSTDKVVALNSEALQALEEFEITHTAVSEYADTRPVAAASGRLKAGCLEFLMEIEGHILDQYSDARDSDDGFLTGQIYWFHYAQHIIATRAHLMQETIRALSPSRISMFRLETDEEYVLRTQHSWHPALSMLNILEELSLRYSFQIDVYPYSAIGKQLVVKGPNYNRLGFVPQRARRLAGRIKRSMAQWLAGDNIDSSDLCMLFAGGTNHEWKSVTRVLNPTRVYLVDWVENDDLSGVIECAGWSTVYDTYCVPFTSCPPIKLEFGAYRWDEEEIVILTDLYDKWLSDGHRTSEIKFQGLDLIGDMSDVLRPLVVYGLSLCRHIDRAVTCMLDNISPDAVCSQGIINMADRRLARACMERSIPLLSMQHGGSIGTHVNAGAELNDWAYSDYYLTYGEGIKTYPNPIIPQRASLVAVGSARLEYGLTTRSSPDRGSEETIRVLWVSEKSFGNTIGHQNRIEDTRRYLLQKKCLSILAGCAGMRVTFRPVHYTTDMLGTVRWVESDPFVNIYLDADTEFHELLDHNDIVITDVFASSVWNEAIAFEKPLILYCDPLQTPLMSQFEHDLELSCHLCKTEEELVDAVQKLVEEGKDFIEDLRQVDTTVFLEKYVLHRNDGRCAERAASLIREICCDDEYVGK